MTQVATQQTGMQSKPTTITSLLSAESVKKRFDEILGKNSASFISSIISATKANPKLMECEPGSVISSAIIAATLKLPIQSNLGFAYIIPYVNKGRNEAQFQMGYKGFIQLAIRTNQYQNINATEIYEGELKSFDRITGEVVLDTTKKVSEKIIGYVAYFKLTSGFEKMLYMSKDKLQEHGKRYSKSYSSEYSRWSQDFDAMALKTVIKQLLSKFGILSVEMETAINTDQAIIRNADTMEVEYVDNTEDIESSALDTKEMPTIEVKTSEEQKKMDTAAKPQSAATKATQGTIKM